MEQWKEDILAHYGILGMKWGIRRYQRRDGTLTEAGIKRYRSEGYQFKNVKPNDSKYYSSIIKIRDDSQEVKNEINRLKQKGLALKQKADQAYKYAEQAIDEIDKKELFSSSYKQLKKDISDMEIQLEDEEALKLVISDIVDDSIFNAAFSTPSGLKVLTIQDEIDKYADDISKSIDSIVKEKGSNIDIGSYNGQPIKYSQIVGTTMYESLENYSPDRHSVKNGVMTEVIYNSNNLYKELADALYTSIKK